MNPDPKISVVMSVYDTAAFLEQAIRSILEQSFKDFEFLIVDDASTDGSLTLIEQWAKRDDRIRVLKNQTRLGLTGSLNHAIGQAKAQWIARQDADDLSYPDRLQLQMECLTNNPQLGLVGTYYEGIDQQGRHLYRMILPAKDRQIKEWLNRINCFCHGSVIFSKKEFLRVKGYPAYPFAQDYALWLRMAPCVSMENFSGVLYKRRMHSESISDRHPERWQVLQQLKLNEGLVKKPLGPKQFIAREHFYHGQFLMAMRQYRSGTMSLLKGGFLFVKSLF